MQAPEANPKIRDCMAVEEADRDGDGDDQVERVNRGKKSKLDEWHEGVIIGAGLAKNDPRLVFRRTMFAMARKQAVWCSAAATREHVALYVKAFNAWAAGDTLGHLRCAAREPVPAIARLT